ncbi:hypothetical protein XU18_3683 [Perkinsela sp. CCAP 1560/4]|nr:hypothetical protein XU18_3683 [Perkinsela sp. CCAP 1560/4]|eukprot:KNH05279.1 hypothetical protein XU18_3683 [Perkinsela sp. CCAP 1560/4]
MSEEVVPHRDPATRKPKSKVLLILGYIGTDYHGSASNADVDHPTVEDTLLEALHTMKLIDQTAGQDNWTTKLAFQRASRTDKGVHALSNAVSVNLHCEAKDLHKLPAQIHHFLPEKIRIFCALPVISSFNSYRLCTGRKYNYYLPLYSLLGPTKHLAFAEHIKSLQELDMPLGVNTLCGESTFCAEKYRCIENFMPDKCELDSLLEKVNALFSKFCGTHSFHNFTRKCDAAQASNYRYIIEMKIKSFNIDEVDYLAVHIHGQSFMLNQIRKMVGSAICAVNEGLSDSFFESLLNKNVQKYIPMLPANGLVLESLDFHGYNSKLDRIQPFGNAKDKPKIDLSPFRDEMDEFARRVQRQILEVEQTQRPMAYWLGNTMLSSSGAQ